MKTAYVIEEVELPPDDPIRRTIREHFAPVDDPRAADMVLVLGGDGGMLKAIRRYLEQGVPFCGLNYGHIGFLMNTPGVPVLEEILRDEVEEVAVNMLEADLYDTGGRFQGREYAFNDMYFERSSPQTAKVRITVNGTIRFDPLIGDGVIVSTSAGSSAYNASAGGAILPIGTNSMVLTGICPAVFHYWRTAQLAADARVILEPVETDKRPVRFVVDGREKTGVGQVRVGYSPQVVCLIFARSQDFGEKVMNLQFHGSTWRAGA